MKTNAAIAWTLGQPLNVNAVNLDLGFDEMLGEFKATRIRRAPFNQMRHGGSIRIKVMVL